MVALVGALDKREVALAGIKSLLPAVLTAGAS